MERRLREPGGIDWKPPSRLRLSPGPLLGLLLGFALFAAASLALFRQGSGSIDAIAPAQQRTDAAGLALIAGLILFSTLSVVLHAAARRRWTRRRG